MVKKTVFLLQDTKELNDQLKQSFNSTQEFTVIGSAEDAVTAISILQTIKPDFIITELVLSTYDGLSVISRIKEMGINSKIIVLSALCSEDVVSLALSKGASYFMAKPFSFELLYRRMLDLTEGTSERIGVLPTKRQTSLEEKISKIFINVGIPPHIKGYSFLREGVKMAVEEPDIINSITKKLYPKIGEKYSTSASKVERAIRHAIEVAWNRGRIDTINSILGVRAYVGAEKPTNGEFIALVADKMLLEKA